MTGLYSSLTSASLSDGASLRILCLGQVESGIPTRDPKPSGVLLGCHRRRHIARQVMRWFPLLRK